MSACFDEHVRAALITLIFVAQAPAPPKHSGAAQAAPRVDEKFQEVEQG